MPGYWLEWGGENDVVVAERWKTVAALAESWKTVAEAEAEAQAVEEVDSFFVFNVWQRF